MPGKKKRILVCPLDWGIGHATRCVPIIKALLDRGAEVVIAADGLPLKFLRGYFPGLQTVAFPGTRISYPAMGNMALKMLASSPRILRSVREEHQVVEKLVDRLSADGVISDNRFGCWSAKVPSVYITHQVMIKTPPGLKFFEPLLYRVHRSYMNKYDETWIPDLSGEFNLSGDLSHLYPLPDHAFYVGPLSRFQPEENQGLQLKADDRRLIAILSGPEPQRTMLEKMITEQADTTPDWDIILLQGLPGSSHPGKVSGNLEIYAHLPDNDLVELLKACHLIICRPGYSTLMDLAMLNLGAVLVPTPGQTEQEYLASFHSSGEWFVSMEQKSFSLARATALKPVSPLIVRDNNGTALQERVEYFLERI